MFQKAETSTGTVDETIKIAKIYLEQARNNVGRGLVWSENELNQKHRLYLVYF